MKGTEDWLPLFPLDLALLPGALLPLHVFEPRYRALTRRSLDGDQEFGVVRLHDGNLARVGCAARILQVLHVYPDGRSDILARGEGRFSLLDLREHADGYLEARAGAVCDEPGPAVDPEDRLLLERLFREYSELAEDGDLSGVPSGPADAPETAETAETADAAEAEGGSAAVSGMGGAVGKADTDAAADDARFSFGLAARVPLGTEERQALLETLSERERTAVLLGHMARLVPRLRAHEKDRRKVRGNGKPVPPEE